MKQQIIANNGSVQNIDSIPSNVKEVYKTVWEMSKKVLVDMMIARNEYICQSQSFNVFDQSPDYKKLTSLHFYAWKRGAKTGLYYLRTKAATDAIKCTVDHNIVVAAENKNKQQQLMMNKNKKEEKEEELKRKIEEEIGCLNCGS
jgi:ribonucleoside-diphosphate reductase alpha chain